MIFERRQIDRIRTKLSRSHAQLRKSWGNRSGRKVLLVVDDMHITRSQIFPFYYYLQDLEHELDITVRELSLSSLQKNERILPEDADIVFFQPWFTVGIGEIARLAALLRKTYPGARLVFLDSYAPLDLRFAEDLEPFVDSYVKKHVFSDRSAYGKTTQGDTNLVDFYEKLYELPPSPEVTFAVSEHFLSRLVVGPTFFTSSFLLPRFHRQGLPTPEAKNLRVHARLGCNGTPWYQGMREHALSACESFAQQSTVTSEATGFNNYINELSRSMICFSPFGYGEVCIRDYEAIACGALLVKPDMSHVETRPDVFLPGETYVPVKWDFSDLADKLDYYLSHENETREIAHNAYRILHDYCRNGGFVEQLRPLFTRLAPG